MKRAKKKPAKVPLTFRIPAETNRTLEKIARCAETTVAVVVQVILATRIVTEREARKVKS